MLTPVYGLWMPRLMGLTSSFYDNTTLLVDAAGERAAFIFRAPATGTLKKVAFRTGAVTQNQTIRVSFQDVTPGTGFPDGVVDQYRDVPILDTDDHVPIETGIISSDGTDGGTLRSVTRGELLAVVFEHPFNTGNVFRLSQVSSGNDASGSAYFALYTTSWSKILNLVPAMALIYDDAGQDRCRYFPDAVPCTQGYTFMGFNSASSNPRRGLKFRLPFSATLVGAMLRLRSAGNFEVKLYDSDGQTVLLTQTVLSATTDTSFVRWHHVKFNGEASLAKETYYYLLVEPTTTTSVELHYMDVPPGKEYYLDQMDGGRDFHYAERSTGAPTAITTRRPLISLDIASVDDGTGVMRPGPWGMIR
jgi:hypothetical protein